MWINHNLGPKAELNAGPNLYQTSQVFHSPFGPLPSSLSLLCLIASVPLERAVLIGKGLEQRCKVGSHILEPGLMIREGSGGE